MQPKIVTFYSSCKNIDIRTVDRNTLVDINDVNIDKKLPREQRLEDYVRQIGNPYCYKCGEAIVKISFSETTATLEERIENYLKTF